jgi:hypothetical protein
LYEFLSNEGYFVWWDQKEMPSGGRSFIQEVKEAIADTDRILLISTPGATESSYVRDEWEYALSLCKVVTPLPRAGEHMLLQEPFKYIHAIDFRESRSRNDALNVRRVLHESNNERGNLFAVPELPHYLPRDTELTHLRAQLLSDLNKTVVVTGVQRHAGVQGMGGIGKTVLASAVVRDCVIRRSYNDGVYWITIGQNPQLLSVQSQLGEMLGDSARNLCNLEDGKRAAHPG